MNVAVLFGGTHAERPVSILSGGNVVRALVCSGYRIFAIDTAAGVVRRAELDRVEQRARQAFAEVSPSDAVRGGDDGTATLGALSRLDGQVDLCFLALHGKGGECGTVQALLERREVPYVGSTSDGSALAFDKHEAKQVVRRAGLRTPDWWLARSPGLSHLGTDDVVVKPRRHGSSIGVRRVPYGRAIDAAVAAALQYDHAVLVEEFVPGRDITVGVLGDQALCPVEVCTQAEVFSYARKYSDSGTTTAPVHPGSQLDHALRKTALQVHKELGLRHLSRIDFRVDSAERIWFLEANSLPGLTRKSLYPQSAAAAGVGFDNLLERLCHMAFDDGPVRVGGGDEQ